MSPLPARCTDTVTVTDASQPNLIVTKSASVASTSQNGTFSYTVAVSNSGPVDSSANTNIVDNFVAGISITAISNGAGWICTPSGALPLASPASINCVKAAGVSAGASNEVVATFNATKTSIASIDNTATITSGDPACVSPLPARCTDTVTVTDASQPNLVVAKSASVASTAQNGTFTYTVAVSNTGPIASGANTTIVDTFVAGVSITAITNGPGWICTPAGALPLAGPSSLSCVKAAGVSPGAANEVVVTLDATKTGTSSVDNTATITSGDPACVSPLPARCTDVVTVTDASSPNLIVDKTASVANTTQNGTFTYNVVVSNSGPVDSGVNTTIVDTFVAGVSITAISNGAGWACTPAGALPLAGPSSISCVKAAGVSAGASNEVVATFNATKTSTGSVDNTVTITSGDPSCISPLPAHCTDTVTVTDATTPRLQLTKTASPNPFVVAQPASYAITVTNIGAVATTGNLSVSDTLPAGITLVSASGVNWSCAGTTALTCTFTGVLSASASSTLTLMVDVGASATSGTNTAIVSGGGDPACPSDPSCDDTVVVGVTRPDLMLDKSHSGTFVAGLPGGNYSLVVRNVGTATSTGPVSVIDLPPAGLTATAINGSGWTCVLATLTCTRADALAPGNQYPPIVLAVSVNVGVTGALQNTGVVTGGGDSDPSNNTDADPVTVVSGLPGPVSVPVNSPLVLLLMALGIVLIGARRLRRV